MRNHNLLGITGYIYKQAHCTCGWKGRQWESIYGWNIVFKARKIAKRE